MIPYKNGLEKTLHYEKMEELTYSLYSLHNDKNGNPIFYQSSKLLLPDGRVGKLLFCFGQLEAYFADLEGYVFDDLEGVNNVNSFNLRNCEVIK
ncbi:hypothetical protein WAF17_21200 [Bernardetia sp. ABR2-2B]|uniref:hypothetical protein n=1 Tax=Bernardetia sp. ABR2-2B TaxID=3127472 RepID=UPI0030CEF210